MGHMVPEECTGDFVGTLEEGADEGSLEGCAGCPVVGSIVGCVGTGEGSADVGASVGMCVTLG